MSRTRNKFVNPTTGIYALVYHDIIDSKAFKSLSNSARVTFLLLRRQCKIHNQRTVMFPYDHAVPYMTKTCFSRSLKDLEEKGFIKIDHKASMMRVPNEYTFIDKWKEYSKDKKKRVRSGIVLKESIKWTRENGIKGGKISPLNGQGNEVIIPCVP